MFDAPDHTAETLLLEARKRGWRLTGLWLTHGHFDHLADHQVVREHFPQATHLIHQLDNPKAQQVAAQTRMFGVPMDIPPFKAEAFVTDGQELKIGSCRVVVMHTPGHSPGHVSYYLPDERILIGGDLIIGGSVGRTDLPDSKLEDLQRSIRRVMTLPPDTRLLGGHGPETLLADERENNPYVRFALEEE
jgi:hydroxyacylglutathione hydrolase